MKFFLAGSVWKNLALAAGEVRTVVSLEDAVIGFTAGSVVFCVTVRRSLDALFTVVVTVSEREIAGFELGHKLLIALAARSLKRSSRVC